MRKLFGKLIRNNKGLSFVELICTVAIFSTVMTIVGGAMIVSANNYSRGSDELGLQQEAQTTINLISNMVLDAFSVSYSGGTLTIENPDTTYEIKLSSTPDLDTNLYDLLCSQKDFELDADGNRVPKPDDPDVQNIKLAENVAGFSADASHFSENKNVSVTLELNNASKTRTFEMTYNITSRNGEKGGSAAGEFAYIMIDTIVLEPGDEYTFSNVSNKPVQWGSVNSDIFVEGDDITYCGRTSNDTRLTSSDTSGATLKIGLGEKAEKIVFRVQTQETSAETDEPLAYKDVTVYIRRVNKINLSGAVTNGVAEKTLGAEYKVDVSFADTENKNLRNIHAINGSYDFRQFENVTFTYTYNLDSNVTNMIQEVARVQNLTTALSETNCYIKFKLKNDLPPGGKITVTATATRPGLKGYEEVVDTYVIENGANGNGPFSIPGTGLRRGDDDRQIEFQNFETYKSEAGGVGELVKEWRYREKITNIDGSVTYGAWSEWAVTQDRGTNLFKFNAAELLQLDPTMDYEIEIKAKIVDNGVQKWPGPGAPESLYLTRCEITHAHMVFTSFQDPEWSTPVGVADGSRSIGSHAAPKVLTKGQMVKFNYDVEGGVANYFQAYLKVDAYKWNGTSWESTTLSEYHVAPDDFHHGHFRVKFDQPGEYKITFRWEVKDGDNPLYYKPYSNETTNEGFMYIKVNN